MHALVQLDYRSLRNEVLIVLHSPARLAIWIPYVLLAGGLGIYRLAAGGRPETAPSSNAAAFATLAGGAYLAAFGFALARHASGRIQAFRCPAEAFLYAGAGFSPLLLASWLQVRNVGSAAARWLGTIVLYIGAFAPASATRDELLRAGIAIVVAALGLSALELPAFALGRARFGGIAVAAGWAICMVGAIVAICAAAGLLGDLDALERVKIALGFDPGDGVRAILAGRTWPLVALALLALLPAAAFALCSRDPLAALYEGTLHPAHLSVRAAGALGLRRSEGNEIPNGLGALFWKDWVAMQRGGGQLRSIATFVAWWAFGTVLAFASASGNDRGLVAALAVTGVLIVALVPVACAAGAVEELAGTLCWLAPASVVARLGAWTISQGWPGALALCGLPLALGSALGRPEIAIAGLLAAVCGWWAMTAFALAVQTVLPGRFDLRGPFGALRMLGAFAFLLLPLWTFAAAGAYAAAAVAAALGSLAVLVAAQRILSAGPGVLRPDRARA